MIYAFIAAIVLAAIIWMFRRLSKWIHVIDGESQQTLVDLRPVQVPAAEGTPSDSWMEASIFNNSANPIRKVEGIVFSLAGEVKHELTRDVIRPHDGIQDKWPKVPGDEAEWTGFRPQRSFNAIFEVSFTDKNRSRWLFTTEGEERRVHAPIWIHPFLISDFLNSVFQIRRNSRR